jgi:hypothetical protein
MASSQIDETYLNNLYSTLNNEKTKLFNDLKNDTEMKHEKFINQKITHIDSIIKSTFKLRNTINKEKLKCDFC